MSNSITGTTQSSQLTQTASTPSTSEAQTAKSALPTSDETKSKALPDQKSTEKVALEQKSATDSSSVPTPKPEENQVARDGARFAALSRKERDIQAKTQEIKAEAAKVAQEKAASLAAVEAERSKFKADVEAFAAQRKEYEEFQALKKLNPLKAIEKLGWSYQHLTDIVLNDSKPTPEMLVEDAQKAFEAKLEAYKKELEQKDAQRAKEQEEAAQKALEEAKQAAEAEKLEVLNTFRGEIYDFIEENSNEYELINVYQQQEYVYATIDKYYNDTLEASPDGIGKIMSIKEASDLTERWLASQVEAAMATNKYKAKASSQAPKESVKEVTQKQQAPVSKTPNTLTNNMTSAATPTNHSADTEADRIRRALAALDRVA